MARMTEDQLAALCDGQINDARRYENSELADGRTKALEFMRGEIDVPSEKGKSSVTSSDLSDVMGWIMPGMLRVFLGSDKVVNYEPRKPEYEDVPVTGPDGQPQVNPQTGQQALQKKDVSEDRAEQATDYVNYVFLNECSGYQVFYDAIHDGLLLSNGIIKHWWDDQKDYVTEDFTALSDDDYMSLVSNPDVEKVLEHTPYPDPGFVGYPSQGAEGGGGPGEIEGDSETDRPYDGDISKAPTRIRKGIGTGDNIDAVPNHRPEHIAGQEREPTDRPAPEAGFSLDQDAFMRDMQTPMLHDCKIKRCKNPVGNLRIMAMPPEEFLIHRSAKKLDEDTLACGHYYQDTRSNLIKQGYSRKKVGELPSGSGEREREQVVSEREENTVTDTSGGGDSKDASTERVDVYEWYPLVDYDGDGVAERRRVVMAGMPSKRTILENEEWGDDLPFTDIVPCPVPHRWRGRSMYDDIKDSQVRKSVLWRQALDNLYMSNNPMKEVLENSVVNMDQLVDWTIGGNVFVKQKGAITPLVIPFTAKESFAMLAYEDEQIEKKTGVSRSTMALDMEALQNQTATATNAATAAAATKVETYARNMAEVGFKRLFRCLLKLVVKHQDRPRTIRLRNAWTEMEPSGWDADMDVTINTGLGSGSREKDMTILQAIKQTQEQILMSGKPEAAILVPLDKYRHTLTKQVESAGLKNPDQFYGEVTPEIMQKLQQQQAQPQPDPKAMEAQAKMQLESQKAQADMQLAQAKAQAEAQQKQAEAQVRAQHEREKAGLDLQLARDRASAELQLQRERNDAEILHMREKAAQEFELKKQELALEAELKREQMRIQATMAQSTNIQQAPPQ